MTVGAVIMAAGLSRRFGRDITQNKLNASLQYGTDSACTVFQQTLFRTMSVIEQVVVVTRPDYHQVKMTTRQANCSLLCLESDGLGTSIACGVAYTTDWDGWLIVLADMPFVQAETYRCLQQNIVANRIVRPLYREQYGHPVGFGGGFKQQLLHLKGDQGARSLISAEELQPLIVNDPGVTWDIDYPEALVGPLLGLS